MSLAVSGQDACRRQPADFRSRPGRNIFKRYAGIPRPLGVSLGFWQRAEGPGEHDHRFGPGHQPILIQAVAVALDDIRLL